MMRVMMMGRVMARMTETAGRSVPRRDFDLSQADEIYGQRSDRSCITEKFY